MGVRAKMRCDAIERNADGGATILLYPVTGNSPENDKFFQYTPSGCLVLSTVNAEAVKQFTVGEEYYVDITSAVTVVAEPEVPQPIVAESAAAVVTEAPPVAPVEEILPEMLGNI